MVDAGRHEHRVHRLKLLGLGACAESRPAFDDDIHFVRAAVLPSGFLLVGL